MSYTSAIYLNIMGACLISLAGCTKQDPKDTIIRIDPEFRIELHETMGTQRQFGFTLESLDLQPCLNSTIDNSLNIINRNIFLSIEDILQQGSCLPGEAPATAVALGGNLPGDGVYTVQISLKNTIKNTGKLTVTPESYLLEMETDNGLELGPVELRRVPSNTIWGYFAYDSEEEAGNDPEQFESDLESICELLALEPGNYGYYFIDENGDLHLDSIPQHQFVKTFHFHYEGSTELLSDLVQAYRNGHAQEERELKVFTWMGEEF